MRKKVQIFIINIFKTNKSSNLMKVLTHLQVKDNLLIFHKKI